MAIGKQSAAKKVWDSMQAAGENLDAEWVISQAISLTSPNTDPRLYPSDPTLAYQDRSTRFQLARRIIGEMAFPRSGGGFVAQQNKRIVITTKTTADKSEKWEEADEKTKEFRDKVKKAGNINLKKDDAEYLKNKGYLPDAYQGTEISSALHLYAKGMTSENLAGQAELAKKLSQNERDYLLRTAYIMATFEEANLKEGLPATELLQNANLSPEITEIAERSKGDIGENEFLLMSDGEDIMPVLPSIPKGQDEKTTLNLKQELSDTAFKAVEKGGEKIAKKAAAKVAGKAVEGEAVNIAAKAGVKAVLKTGIAGLAQAAGTSVPVVGNILAWLAVEVGEKVLGWVKNQLVKVGKFIRQHDNLVAGLGVGAFLAGVLFGAPLLSILGLMAIGALALFGDSPQATIGAITGVVAGLGIIVLLSVKVAFEGISSVVIGVLAFLILVILTFYIITVGGYVVPYWSGGSSGGIDPNPGNISYENPYIGVGKVADPTKASDPGIVRYTISIVAKQGNLTNIQVTDYKCESVNKAKQKRNCPPPSTASAIQALIPSDLVVEVGQTYTFDYTVIYDSSAYADSLVTDTITITADAPGHPGESSTSSASVCFGDCPDECPSRWPVDHGAVTQGYQTCSSCSHDTIEAIDIGSVDDTASVYATHGGVVEFPNDTPCEGIVIMIKSTCNGKEFRSRYSHLKSRSVTAGSTVSAGQRIGVTDNTGTCTTGSHLHYEIRGMAIGPTLPKPIQPSSSCCTNCGGGTVNCATSIP